MPRPPRSSRSSPRSRTSASGCPTAGYLPDAQIATTVFLADRLGKPLLVEGPAGTGKTELAKALATATGSELIRLQCYEGLDEARALYEWNYKKQLLRIQASQGTDGADWNTVHDDIFGEEFLLSRPLLTAIRRTEPTVLLIDETDKADVEVEGLLLEVLSDFQVTIPELGTITADPPADGGAHLERHPRAVRGAQAALPVPGAGLPVGRAGAGDRAVAGARPGAGPGRAAGAHGAGAAGAGAEEVAVDLRDPRLGADAARAGPGHPGRVRGALHAGRGAQARQRPGRAPRPSSG